MKTMTCKQLGGACDMQFHAQTFEEMTEHSQKHGQQMAQQQDESHLKAMEKIKQLMQESNAMQKWMDETRSVFESMPDDAQ